MSYIAVLALTIAVFAFIFSCWLAYRQEKIVLRLEKIEERLNPNWSAEKRNKSN